VLVCLTLLLLQSMSTMPVLKVQRAACATALPPLAPHA
jgi:hypothetical protein